MSTKKTRYAAIALAVLDGLLCPVTLARGALGIRQEIREDEASGDTHMVTAATSHFLMYVLAVASVASCLVIAFMLLPFVVDARAVYWVSGAMSVLYAGLAVGVGISRFSDYSEKNKQRDNVVPLASRRAA